MCSTIPVIYDETDEPKQLPWKWEICTRCDGHGRSSAHMGAFTREELDDDYDFREDYLSGAFDRVCEHCCAGKVQVLDRDLCSPKDLAIYDQQRADEIADRETQRMEMMMEGRWR